MESGGTAEDVMQSSESLGLPPNSLDTESSIKQGCKYFASLLSSCKEQGITDINVAIQSYNFGGSYVGYVAGNGKKHTYNLRKILRKINPAERKLLIRTRLPLKRTVAGDIVMAINFMSNLSTSIFMLRSLMMKRCRRL